MITFIYEIVVCILTIDVILILGWLCYKIKERGYL
jgi:hypothetical protein